MDDARPQLAADAAQVRDVVEQRVHQRAVAMPGAGCTTIPAGLLTTTRSRVLVDDVERKRLGSRRWRDRVGHIDA